MLQVRSHTCSHMWSVLARVYQNFGKGSSWHFAHRSAPVCLEQHQAGSSSLHTFMYTQDAVARRGVPARGLWSCICLQNVQLGICSPDAPALMQVLAAGALALATVPFTVAQSSTGLQGTDILNFARAHPPWLHHAFTLRLHCGPAQCANIWRELSDLLPCGPT